MIPATLEARLIAGYRDTLAALEAADDASIDDRHRAHVAARRDLFEFIVADGGAAAEDPVRHERFVVVDGRLARRPMPRGRLMRWVHRA